MGARVRPLAHIPYGLCGIYAIRDTRNGRVYVGQSVNIKQRLCCHRSAMRKGVGGNPWMQHIWAAHGEEVFDYVILELCNRSELSLREQYWIDNSALTFNVARSATPGPAEGRTGWTEERRAHQSALMRGNNYARGLVYSQEERAVISARQTGKKLRRGDAWRQKTAERMRMYNAENNKHKPQNQPGRARRG